MAILCGTDLSARAAEGAAIAARLAARLGEPLWLLHVVESGDAERQRPLLEAEARRLRALQPGLQVDPRLAPGLPDDVMASLASGGSGEPPPRLVVLSALGRRESGWVLGSVAERTVQRSTVPVLIVRDARPWAAWLDGTERLRLLVGFDFGGESEAALRWASELASLAPCEVVVMHLTSAEPAGGSARGRRGRRALASEEAPETRLLADLRAHVASYRWPEGGPRARVVTTTASRAPLIAQIVSDERAELVILGSRPREAPGLAWQVSVLRGVLYHATSSVLCVPLPGAGAAVETPEVAGGTGASLREQLEQHPFLRGVPGDLLQRLATIARVDHAEVDTIILREGADADRLLLIQSGVVALEVAIPGKAPIRLETLGRGDILGLSWLTPPYRWQFDARAVEPVTLVSLDAPALREWMRDDPRVGQAVAMRLVGQLQQRLQRVRLQRLDVYGAES